MFDFYDCYYLKAKQAFSMKMPGARGRAVTVKAGDLFWVTTGKWKKDSLPMIQRKGKGHMGTGYPIDPSLIFEFFEPFNG